MNEDQKPSITPSSSQFVPQNVTPDTEPSVGDSPAKRSLLGTLAATFFFGLPFFGLLTREIIDTSYDGGGLGYAIIFIFIFPPFLVLSILSLIKIRKLKSSGETVGLRIFVKAALFGLAGLAAVVAIPLAGRVWDSFF